MREKKRYPWKRIWAMLLAIMLIVNMIPGSVMMSLAAGPYTVRESFELLAELGNISDITITIKDAAGQTIVKEVGTTEIVFTGEVGNYSYEISTDKYGKPITGAFSVEEPADPDAEEIRGVVLVTETFDTVEGQFTQVQVSGTVTDGSQALSGIGVEVYYGVVGGTEAFKTTTDVNGEYTGMVDVNRDVVIHIVDPSGKYAASDETLNSGTVTVTRNVTMAIVQHTVTLTGIDNNIIETATLNGADVMTGQVNHGEDAVIELKEKTDAAGRYAAKYTVNGGTEETLTFTDGTATVTIQSDEDKTVEFKFETTLKLEKIEYPSGWKNGMPIITGTVSGAEDGFTVKLVSATDYNTEIASSTDAEFSFACGDGTSNIIDKYRIILVDNKTGLTTIYPEEDIVVQVDNTPPVIEGITYSSDNTWETDEKGKNWAKSGASYSVSATDADSGIDGEDNYSVTGNDGKERTFRYDTDGRISRITVEVPDKQGETVEDVTDTVIVKDNVENPEEKTISYGIDNEAPEIEEFKNTVDASAFIGKEGLLYNGTNWFWNMTDSFDIPVPEPIDKGVGLADYSYIIKKNNKVALELSGTANLTWSDGAVVSITPDKLAAENGAAYEVYVKAKDKLGNISNETLIAEFTADVAAPEIQYKFNTNDKWYEKLGKFLGIYHNSNLEVTVTATDKGVGYGDVNGIFSSLKYNDNEIEPDDVTLDGNTATATYTITLSENEGLWSIISVQAKDALGNGEGKEVLATMGSEGNSNLKDYVEKGDIKIMLEDNEPDIQDETFSYTENTWTDTKRGIAWFSKNNQVTYGFTVSDVDSGIFDINCYINDKDKSNEKVVVSNQAEDTLFGKDGPVKEQSENIGELAPDKTVKNCTVNITLNEKDIETESGKCKMELKAIDNAGNVKVVEKVIYFDIDAPVINSFKFEPADVNDKSGEDVNDGSTVIAADYGYFFIKDTLVTVNVTDYVKGTQNAGSGVKQVQYQLEAGESSKVASKAWTELNSDSSDYSFTVPEGFKGQIYVRAMDNVEQKTSGYKNGEMGTRPKGVVLEGMGTHNSKTSLSVSLSDTPYTDAKGNRLYAGTATATVKGENTFAGINSAVYKRTGRENSQFTGNIDSGNGVGETGEFSTTSDNNLVTELNLTDAVNFGADQEVSDITLDFSMTCNAKHTDSVAQQTISYDTWAPRLTITWDNNDVRNEKYYNANRTATIVVTERNFDESKCEFITTGQTPAISGWSHNGDVHTAMVSYTQDGDYTFSFRVTDRAGHTTDYGQTDTFTIDKTAPVISVSYDNNDARNGYYYKNARTASITINEHNFRASEVSTTMTANDNGAGIAVPSVNGWSTSGDINSATINYSYDGEFTFGMTYEDLAGNPAVPYGEDHFVVDLTDPELEIYDIVDKSANNDVVAPGVRYSDTNYDSNGVAIELKGANNGAYQLDGSRNVIANGVDLKLNDFPREKEVDDLYTMIARVEDLSGRVTEAEVMFSVNRFGSVYVLDDSTKMLVEKNDGYTNKEQKIGIREINVDLLEAKEVSVSRDGELKKLSDKEYSVKASGNENTWKEYYYQLDAVNFEEEGSYNVTIFSTDRAANTQDNKNNKRNEECKVEFVIDKTSPTTVVTGIEDAGRYRETGRDVHIDAKDNIRLAEVIVEIDGEQRNTFDSSDIVENNGSIDFTIDSADRWQSVKIYSVDKAGNTDEQEVKSMRVIITSSVWVQFINNTVLLIAVILTIVALAAGFIWFFFIAKRRKDEEEAA